MSSLLTDTRLIFASAHIEAEWPAPVTCNVTMSVSDHLEQGFSSRSIGHLIASWTGARRASCTPSSLRNVKEGEREEVVDTTDVASQHQFPEPITGRPWEPCHCAFRRLWRTKACLAGKAHKDDDQLKHHLVGCVSPLGERCVSLQPSQTSSVQLGVREAVLKFPDGQEPECPFKFAFFFFLTLWLLGSSVHECRSCPTRGSRGGVLGPIPLSNV